MDEERNPMASMGPGSFPPGPNGSLGPMGVSMPAPGSLGPMGVSMPAPGADNVLPKVPWRAFFVLFFSVCFCEGFWGDV